MSDVLEIALPEGLEFGAAAQKNFLEGVPYILGKPCKISITDGVMQFVGMRADIDESLREKILDAVKRSAGTVERAVERVLDSNLDDCVLHEGITEILEARGDIRCTGKGKYVYSGDVAQVFRGIDDLFRGWAETQAADEEFFPVSVRTESLAKAGYFNSFSQHAYFVSPLTLSVEAIESAQSGEIFDAEADASVKQHLQTPEWVLSPTVCHHCFESRSGRTESSQQTVTALNQCSRYEVHDTGGLQRLRHYWMREIIYFRPNAKDVQSALDDILKVTTDYLRKWGISFRVSSASDPFFLDSGSSKRLFQTSFLLKRELQLPVEGKHIACASFNNHQESLTGAFEISAEEGSVASGCVGWGYDRLILALFSQLGPNVDQWPEAVRSDLNL